MYVKAEWTTYNIFCKLDNIAECWAIPLTLLGGAFILHRINTQDYGAIVVDSNEANIKKELIDPAQYKPGWFSSFPPVTTDCTTA